MNFPGIIRSKRKALGETQSEFGLQFGVTAMTVSYWENGKREAPYKVIEFCLGKDERKIKSVKIILFDAEKGLPIFVLDNGEEMVPKDIPTGSCWVTYWGKEAAEKDIGK